MQTSGFDADGLIDWATANAWYLNFTNGYQGDFIVFGTTYAWAVHDGVVGAPVVPLPATVWLFGSGLLGLWAMRARACA